MHPDRDHGDSVGQRSPAVPGRRRLITLTVLLIGLSLAGCTRRYTARNLPRELHARPTSNVKTVGLTQLATDSIPLDQVARGDMLSVSIAAGLSVNDTVTISSRVDETGNVLLPHIGSVYVDGLTLEEAESAIKTACIQREIYRNPHVAVAMKQRRMIQVTVLGGVQREGTYTLPAASAGLLHALSLAGGFADNAGTVIEVRLPQTGAEPSRPVPIARADGQTEHLSSDAAGEHTLAGHNTPVRAGSSRSYKIDLASLTQEDPSLLDLQDRAVVMVERRDPLPIVIGGLVKKPNVYQYPVGKDMRLLDAINLAGGESSLVANKVYVIRRRPDQPEPALIELSMRAAKRDGVENILLEPGDTVSVEQTPSTVLLEVVKAIGFNIGARPF